MMTLRVSVDVIDISIQMKWMLGYVHDMYH